MIIKQFEEIVERFPKKTALKTNGKSLSYEELNFQANRVAHAITGKDKAPGPNGSTGVNNQQVALLFDYGSDMIVGLLGALKANKTYVPLDYFYPGKRLLSILEDSGTYLILTDNRNYELAQELSVHSGERFNVLNINTIGDEIPGSAVHREASGDRNAYILYTSGSTGKPKGVLQIHRNVLYYARNWIKRVPITDSDRMSLFTAFTHDGAIPDIYSALLSGACLYPYSMKENGSVEELSRLLAEEKITIWHSTPSLFRHFSGALSTTDHFPHVQRVLLGGESIRAHDLELYKAHFPDAYLVNVYGQTESTVSSLCRLHPENTFDDVSLGEALDETKIFLMDEDGEMVEEMGGGEIVVACDYVAPGYWNDKENTDKVFLHDEHLGRLYRTGDMGRFTTKGTIKMMGRKDFQVKIRGYRIELGEIETVLLHHYAVEGAVVIARSDENSDIHLCAYIVSSQAISSDDLREYLFSELPDYMVPRYFIFLDEMPVTASGKIDRQQLPEPEKIIDSSSTYVAPANEIEEKITAIWQEVLKIEKIGVNDNFIELGGHSLLIMSIISKIHRDLNVELQLTDIFDILTIRQLSRLVMESKKTSFSPIEPVEEKEYYPLSSAQMRLYILQKVNPDNTAYNMPDLIHLPEGSDLRKIEQVFKKLIQRHESLRTSFQIVNDTPVQKVHENVKFEIEQLSEVFGPTFFQKGGFIRPFDLTCAPLLRVGLMNNTSGSYTIFLDMHHIISDGVSIAILVKDYQALSNQEDLPPLRLQYKDFSHWQQGEKEKESFRRQEQFWLKEFEGELGVLDLPYDYPRPIMKSFEGDWLTFEISVEETRAISEMALKGGYTLFMVMAAVLNILLSKLSGQEEIIFGTPIAGRRHVDLWKIIGMFVNTLALRNYPAGERTFQEFLGDIKERLLRAYENQDYPFEELVDRLSVKRDTGRNPIFDIMFVWQNMDQDNLVGRDKENESETGTMIQTVLFDLTLTAMEKDGGLSLSFQYCSKLFNKDTIERFIMYFKKIVSMIVIEPGTSLGKIELISEEEKKRILNDFNNTEAVYPQDKTIHQLFVEQAAKKPDSVGLIGDVGRVSLTYSQLNELSGRLAGLLIEKGVQSDTIVAIMLERSPEMIIGIFGILKAGGAYLPIDPEYPEDRIDYMLRDSSAKILINKSETNPNNKNSNEQNRNFEVPFVLNLDHLNFEFVSNFDIRASNLLSSNLAYIIYTSGSTGRPKGVMMQHRMVINRLNWMQRAYPINETDVLIQKTPYTFDVSVWEIFWWSFQGASLFLPAPGVEKNPEALVQVIEMYRVTVVHFVPSMLNVWLDYIDNGPALRRLVNLKQVFSSGEPLEIYLVEKFNESLGKAGLTRLVNLYGPTEACVDVSYFNCWPPALKNRDRVPIGKPIDNIQLYIVSQEFVLQPIGIAGELLIGGAGLARGYLNRPELSAEKFIKYRTYKSHKTYINYKTGDQARWLPDGNIEFLGRHDHQIKIRGFRVELGEIETRLIGHPWINQVVVIPHHDKDDEKILCAYVVLDFDNSSLAAPDSLADPPFQRTVTDELTAYLSKSLPGYMVPPYFVILEKMPLTANGKLDRKALPRPEINAGLEYIGFRNEVEQGIIYIVADILGIDPAKISVRANFFNIGLNSITVLKLAHRISEEFNIDFPIGTLFTSPTVEGVVAEMKKEHHTGTSRRAVLLNRKTAARNLFLVSGDGRAYIFKELALLLEGHFNVYGILGKGILETGSLPETKQEIYEDFLHEIRLVQPKGPYLLGGHCYGSIICYEMARMLENRKESVAKVVLLDEPAVMVKEILDYLFILGLYNRSKRVYEKFKKNYRSIMTKLSGNGRINTSDINSYEMPKDLEKRRIEINLNYARIISNNGLHYTRIIKSPVLIIKSASSELSRDRRWDPATIARISKANVQLVHTTGEHYTMFDQPYVPMLAQRIKEAV